MAVIPQGVTAMVGSVLSYLITILWILVIVKIIQTVMSIGGFKGGLGGSDKPPKKPKAEKAKDRQDKRVAKDKFDPYHTGKVKFLVVDEDDNPIQGAKIVITPKYARKWFNKSTWRKYTLRTNADGYAPSRNTYREIGSGVIKVYVTALKFIIIEEHETCIEVKPDDEKLVIITMKGKGTKDEHFEPYIHDITINGDQMTLTGEVK